MEELEVPRSLPVFRFADLFAGLGGFHLAARELGGQYAFACELDQKLRTTYRDNFGHEISGDIRELVPELVPEHDLLCAGFPCQPFSKAGAQIGWGDTNRGTVFHNIVEILRVKQPRFILLENVAHFVRHDEGNTYRKVIASLESVGYKVDCRQYSPHQFGVPQIRERMYMVGAFGSLEGFKWPQPTLEKVCLTSVLDRRPKSAMSVKGQVKKCLDTWQKFLKLVPKKAKLPSFPIWAMEFGATYPTDRGPLELLPIEELQQSYGVFGMPLEGLTWAEMNEFLPSHALRAKGFPRWKRIFIQQNRDFYASHKDKLEPWLAELIEFPASFQKFEWNCQGESRNIWKYVIQFRASGVRVKRPSTAPSLVAMTSSQIPIVGWEKRYMTAVECARLQSMDVLPHLPSGIRAFEALGNAVNVTVARAIMKPLVSLGIR